MATRQGVHHQTARRWWKHGILPLTARQLPTGTILVEVVPRPPVSIAGRRIVVADDGETTGDLVRDIVEVLTSVSARRRGRATGRCGRCPLPKWSP